MAPRDQSTQRHHEELRLMLAEYLDYSGYEVAQAADGEEALQLVRGDHVDLIVLDRLLPKLDGLAVLRTLRSSKRGKRVPVILLSGMSGESDRRRALAPFSPDRSG